MKITTCDQLPNICDYCIMMYLNKEFGGEAAQIGCQSSFVRSVDEMRHIVIYVQ